MATARYKAMLDRDRETHKEIVASIFEAEYAKWDGKKAKRTLPKQLKHC